MKIYKPKVLITGSSSGLGFYLAKEFSNRNYQVILNGRNQKLKIASKLIENSDYIHEDMSKANIVKKNIRKLNKNINL